MKIRRYLWLLCVGALFLSLVSVPAAAEDATYAVVSGSATLNVRTQPSTDGAWLGRAYEGDWVQILSTEPNGWHYCRVVSTGLQGYMAGNYLKTYQETVSGGMTGVVKNPVATQYLNLRQYASYDAQVLGIYYNGAKFKVLSYADGWYYVETENGQKGYFRKEFISTTGGVSQGTAVVRTGNSGTLNLRNAPSMSGGVLSRYKNGTQVTVLLKGNLFWQVQVNGKVGFMDPDFLSNGTGSSSSSSASTAPAPATNGYVIVNNPRATQYLNLRQQPSTTAKVVAQYKNGIRLEVIQQGETWCKVYGKATGNIGYVMTQYVTPYGLPASPTKTVQNGNTYVNLRSAPSKTNGIVYEKLYTGAQVTVLTPGDEWTQVRYGNTVGYMMTYFLK